jgi:hypothetical protein
VKKIVMLAILIVLISTTKYNNASYAYIYNPSYPIITYVLYNNESE